MMSLRLVFSLTFIALQNSPNYALAGQYETCIQRQLKSLSYDVGSIDGVIGSKTRAALKKLVEREPALGSLPTISKSTAPVWCGTIGELKGLQSLWPSKERAIKTRPLSDVDADFLSYLEEQIPLARLFIENELDIKLIGVPNVYLSSDLQALSNAIYAAAGKIDNRSILHGATVSQCRGRQFTGSSYENILALCFGRGQPRSWFRNRSLWIKRIISHELAHEFHGQYVGFHRHLGEQTTFEKRGPIWLSEAIASAIELKFAYSATSLKEQKRKYELRERYSGATLKRYEMSTKTRGQEFANYVGYAGVVLAEKRSLAAFGVFFRQTPLLGWRKAFKTAFGVSVDRFYDEFDS